MSNFCTGWYLIYTKPRHEKKVQMQMNEVNVSAFLPLTKKIRIWHDRKKIVEEPLFPSYVFVYLNDRQSYYEGMDADGALYYVRSGKEVARVRDSVVEGIRLIVDQAKDIEVSESRFLPGKKLVISHGALTGLSCEVVQNNNKPKILVRVDLLQRNILVALPTEHLTSV
jgi:transcriptional antiterminator RfaH